MNQPRIYPGPQGYWYRRTNPVTGETRPHGPFNTIPEAVQSQADDANPPVPAAYPLAISEIDRVIKYEAGFIVEHHVPSDPLFLLTVAANMAGTSTESLPISFAELLAIRAVIANRTQG